MGEKNEESVLVFQFSALEWFFSRFSSFSLFLVLSFSFAPSLQHIFEPLFSFHNAPASPDLPRDARAERHAGRRRNREAISLFSVKGTVALLRVG
jgi:hypothetical protein